MSHTEVLWHAAFSDGAKNEDGGVVQNGRRVAALY